MTSIDASPVRIPKAAVVVADGLRRSIVRGELEPGDALPNESELMKLYEVSRPVVREALRIIESESLISVKRGAGGGARVRRPDVAVAARHTALLLQLEGATLEDLFEARATLEPDAVRRLAERHDPNVVQQLRMLHARERRLLSDPTAYAVQATAFHETLIELAGNKTLAVLGRLLLDIVETHHRATLQLERDAVGVARGASRFHGRLIDLIEDGRVDDAVAHWRKHLHDAAESALARLGPATIVDLLDRDMHD